MLLWQAEIADQKLQEIYEKAGADTTEEQKRDPENQIKKLPSIAVK